MLSVTALVQSTVDQHMLAARDRGVSLAITQGTVPPCVLDEVAVIRILDNLVSNAIRHARPETAVEIETSITDNGRVQISVSNAGTGGEHGIRHAVRLPFVDAPRKHGGVGLGLFIVSTLAEAHGGSLVTEERPGNGWRCVVELPLVASAEGEGLPR
jgi:two-component system sensor histidine kinase VanS